MKANIKICSVVLFFLPASFFVSLLATSKCPNCSESNYFFNMARETVVLGGGDHCAIATLSGEKFQLYSQMASLSVEVWWRDSAVNYI